jgi:hypothetical protein
MVFSPDKLLTLPAEPRQLLDVTVVDVGLVVDAVGDVALVDPAVRDDGGVLELDRRPPQAHDVDSGPEPVLEVGLHFELAGVAQPRTPLGYETDVAVAPGMCAAVGP